MSDLWRAYDGVENLPQAYEHLRVNHSLNFVDPVTGAHTQTVEGTWQKFKNKLKRSYGLNNSRFEDHLQEFMWRRIFADDQMGFYNFWRHVAEPFPCE